MSDGEQNRMQHYGMPFDPELYLDLTEIASEFEQMREMQQKVAQRQNEKLERELVLALHHGFDGVDTVLDLDGTMKVQPWTEGNEPHGPPWDSHHRRYDLRGVTYQDIHEAHQEIDNG